MSDASFWLRRNICASLNACNTVNVQGESRNEIVYKRNSSFKRLYTYKLYHNIKGDALQLLHEFHGAYTSSTWSLHYTALRMILHALNLSGIVGPQRRSLLNLGGPVEQGMWTQSNLDAVDSTTFFQYQPTRNPRSLLFCMEPNLGNTYFSCKSFYM